MSYEPLFLVLACSDMYLTWLGFALDFALFNLDVSLATAAAAEKDFVGLLFVQ